MKTLQMTPTALPSEESVSVVCRRLWFPDYACELAETRQLRHDVNSLLREEHQGDPLFHNHLAHGRYNYAYPAVQYRSVLHREKPVAGLWGLGERGLWGLERLETALFSARSEVQVKWQNFSSDTREAVIGMVPKPRPYLVRSFALNVQQARYWNTNPSRRHQDLVLQKSLRFSIFGLLNAVGFKVPARQLEIRILDVPRGTWYQSPPLQAKNGGKTKGRVLVMDIEFEANLSLPDAAGLGIHKAFGWGVLESLQ